MDSIQNGGHVNTEQGNYQPVMEGSYMNAEMNNYGQNSGEQGGMGPEGYPRISDSGHPGSQMAQYNSYNRPGYGNMDGNMGGEYGGGGYGQFQPGSRGSFPGGPRHAMGQVRPGTQGMGPGPGQPGFSSGQQRMMSGQSISQQSGPTPTLNQLLQTPNSQQRFPNSYDGYSGPQKGGDINASSGPYGMPPGWMQTQRNMCNYPPVGMGGPGSSPYRGQGQTQGFNQQGFNQAPNSQSQYNNQGSIHQQPQPPGQPPGSSPQQQQQQQQQRPTPQPSPHQQISPVPSPSPAHRLTPNPSPGPTRPQPQPSPGKQRTSQTSPSPSQRSSSSQQQSPPGASPGGQHSAQHNHLSSPKDPSSNEDVKGETTSMRDSSRPELSPGSVGSRSNTPASLSGASPMPPRPPSQQDGAANSQRMSQSPMSASGYNQQMMPPPMGPNQMGGAYNQGNKMGPGGSNYNPHYQNSQYPSGNYPMRQPGPGIGNYQQNMFNGPNQIGGPGGHPMYNNMPGGPGMNRNSYNNMYGGNMMGMNNQYGNYGGAPGQNSQTAGPPGHGMSSPGPTNGPQANMNSMGSGNTGSNGPMAGPAAQGQTPKGAQAAAQAAMAAASAAARSQSGSSRREGGGGGGAAPGGNQPGGRPGMYNGPPGMGAPGQMPGQQHSMPPQQPMSPLSHMNQMGYNSSVNSMSPHHPNSVSPVPPNMPLNKMHNSSSVNNYNSEQPLPKTKKSKSNSGSVQNSLQNSNIASPNMGMSSPGMGDPNMSVPRPSSTPSDTGSQSNESSMGPVMNNDPMSGHHQQGLHPPPPADHLQHGGPMPGHLQPTSNNMHMETNHQQHPSNVHHHPIRTMANNTAVETTTTVTQSITSPVTSLSTEAGNSNDSQQIHMEPIPAMQNCIPNPQPAPDEPTEPPEKKKKSENVGIGQMPFTRIAPSPGGASVASSGTHEDIDNIGSPAGWSNSAKSGGSGDYMKLYDMGMEPERKPFLDRLFAFLEEKGSPISNMPVISKNPIDLYRLYIIVQDKGGMVEVTKAKKWKEICGLINVSGSASAAFTLKKNYIKLLFAFECRFDRGNMDPTPILAQMENDLEKKRAAKQRNRAPSPGSQSSQDGMQNQFMQNDPNMPPHMGQGMMGNHMMNNMGPHGGPMMGPNSMGGPHHMGPGMQGPGHMMGQMGHQNYGGNSGYMMQGGPNNIGPNGPQAGMMGQMGPGGPMMGPGGPQQGGMMHNNMPPQHGMMPGSGMNMPPNSMMGPNMMQGQGPNMGGPQQGMMPPNSMNPQQQQMMRNSMGQQGGPSNPMMMPPNSAQNYNMQQNPNMMNRMNNDNSVSCQDPFSDEAYSKNSSGQMPYSGMPQNSTAPPSTSPMPPNSGAGPQNGSQMPASSSASIPGSAAPQMPPSSQTPPVSVTSSQATVSTTTTTVSSQVSSVSQPNNSSMPTSTMASSAAQSGAASQPPATSTDQVNSSTARLAPKPSTDTPPVSVPEMMPTRSPSVSSQQSAGGGDQQPFMQPTPTSSFGSQPPPMFSQDSNSNSSMAGEFTPRSSTDTPNFSQQMPAQGSMAPQPGVDVNSSSQTSNATNTTSSTSGRQFPFGDNQFSKPDRFEQGSPSMSQGGNMPPMSQAPMNQGPMGQQGPMNQGPMNYPQGAPGQIPHPQYMNQQQPPQPGMDQSGYRYGNQGQPGQDQYNQGGYHGGAQGGYGPRPPMMNNDQGYQGYPNQPGQYGKPPMQPGMYGTPNKRYPDQRNEFMSPAYNNRGGSMGYTDPMGPMHYTPSRPPYPEPYGADNNMAYGSQPYSDSSTMNYGDPTVQQYPSTQAYSEYSDTSSNSMADRRDQGQWSPMVQRQPTGPYNPNQPVPPYAPNMGMTPPPNMSHMSRNNRMSPTPNRMRDYTMSPSKQKMMGHQAGMPPFKKDNYFPIDSVESTQPLLNKRRRLTKHDVGPNGYKPGSRRNRGNFPSGQIEAWRIMMSLKSGLMAESTWALDTLNILLYDDSTVGYFGLAHLPGLLEVLLDHWRRCLIEIFDFFEDTQVSSGNEDFKQSLIRMAILETANESSDDLSDGENKEVSRANKTIGNLDNTDVETEVKGENSDNKTKVSEDDKENSGCSPNTAKKLKTRKNYTYISRQGKEVKVEDKTDLDGLLDEKYWDVYGEFGDQSDLWEIGKGDLTAHIFTHLEDVNEHKRCSQRFFRKSLKRKADTELDLKSDSIENLDDDKDNSTGAIKVERIDSDVVKDSEIEVQSNNDVSDNEKCETSSETTDSSCDKDHTCNRFMKGVTLKTEPRDLLHDKTDSNDGSCEDKVEVKSYFKDEPRIKLAVKYELLDHVELEQICKTQFGLNTEGERHNVEDESYHRNEPPLCLTSEAQHELGRRCICVSNIFRSMSFIPGNDIEMSRHSGLVYILGKLLLLHHKHLPRSRARRKFDRDDIEEDMVDTTQGIEEWWWDCLNVLRENTLVIFANICAQLRLDVYADEICKPVFDGLLHWVVCPSSCASDPLPTVGPTSVLSPLRLTLEALCKLCIHDKNVDMLLASPPYERIVQLFSVLTKLLANKSDQVAMEFSVVLLSELVKSGSSAARGVALQHPCISLLIDFIETAEQKAVQVANMHTVQMLRDNPENMGTSLDMLRRAATVLLHLARVPENRKLFVHHQSRLLSLVMSQILDHNVATLLSDVLFQCSSYS